MPYLAIASSLLSAFSEAEAGRENAKANRKIASAGLVSDRLRERGSRMQQKAALSSIRANAGAAGVDIGQGSAMQAYLSVARETELEIIMAHKTADANFAARLAGAQALQDAGNAKAVGSLLSGAADIYSYRNKMNSATFQPSSTSGGGSFSSGGGSLSKPGNLSIPKDYAWGSK